MRKLASLQVISNIQPIPDADNIEVARVLGWNVVVKKGEFQIGSPCVYCEIDSVLPSDNEAFAFLESSRFRIKTKKLRGVVSQGICFPMSILPEGSYELDEDLTAVLDIEQYMAPVSGALNGEVQGAFPSFIAKTDETRVQTFGRGLARNVGLKCDYTEKLDGTSATYALYDDEFYVCSRNMRLKYGGNAYFEMAEKYNIEGLLRSLSADYAIQGEIIGPGIQGNKYKLEERKFYIFNIFNITEQKYLNNSEIYEFVSDYDLEVVPRLGEVEIINDSDFFVNLSIGKSALNPKVDREGIVIRAINDGNDPIIGRFSFKAINPKFLLKYEDD